MTGLTAILPSTPVERWRRVLGGIRADGLDCLQSSVAVLADDAHGPGSHLALGSRVRFPQRGADGAVGVQPDLPERLDQARWVLGFEVSQTQAGLAPARLLAAAQEDLVYVVAEAYDLRWLPYARATTRYRAMTHSFLLSRLEGSDRYVVIDAYYADTQWGRARPDTWVFTADEFRAAMVCLGDAVRVRPGPALPDWDPRQVLVENAAAAAAAGPDIDAYVAAAARNLPGPEGIERLVLDIWHLTRERLLFGVWLGRAVGDVPGVRESEREWQQLAAHSYLASRRALRGAAPNPGLADAVGKRLRADRELMMSLATTAGGGTTISLADVEQVVRHEVAGLLGIPESAVTGEGVLRDLPGFDSFRLVEAVERVERRTGMSLPTEYDAAELGTAGGLARLFERRASS